MTKGSQAVVVHVAAHTRFAASTDQAAAVHSGFVVVPDTVTAAPGKTATKLAVAHIRSAIRIRLALQTFTTRLAALSAAVNIGLIPRTHVVEAENRHANRG